MNSKLLVDIEKEPLEQSLIERYLIEQHRVEQPLVKQQATEPTLQRNLIPTLTETIARENRTDSPESHWLKEAVLKEVVSKHRSTVQELAKLMLILNKYNPEMNVFEVKEKLSQQANIMVQACLDECLPSIEHHLRLLLERDLQKQINELLN